MEASWQRRLDEVAKRLSQLKPKSNPLEKALIVELTDELNVNAPRDTETPRASRFVLTPPGFSGSLPSGIPTFEEWQALRMKED